MLPFSCKLLKLTTSWSSNSTPCGESRQPTHHIQDTEHKKTNAFSFLKLIKHLKQKISLDKVLLLHRQKSDYF